MTTPPGSWATGGKRSYRGPAGQHPSILLDERVTKKVTGALLGLTGWSPGAVLHGRGTVLAAGLLTAVLSAGYGPAASVGRGCLPAVGVLFVTVLAAQVVAAVGHGAWFPWAVPAVLTGTAGPAQSVGWAGVVPVLVVGAGGAHRIGTAGGCFTEK